MGFFPIISIVGHSDSGKTTLICRLLPELKQKGYRVCTVKHDVHDFEMDKPGKDTWKHRQAGSDVVMISSASKLAIIEKVDSEIPLEELAKKAGEVDIIITEGYKRENKPKVEVVRGDAPLLCQEEDNLLALVGEIDREKLNLWEIPLFGWDQIQELVELLEKKIIGGV